LETREDEAAVVESGGGEAADTQGGGGANSRRPSETDHPCGIKKYFSSYYFLFYLKDKIARPMEYLKVVCLPT
jgi:hypothetical protein